MKRRTFVFALPPYEPKSNGVHIYYELAQYFTAFGQDVRITPHNEISFGRSKLLRGHEDRPWDLVNPSEVESDWIPIFTDTSLPFFTEKFNTACRVWYLLNKPYALTSEGCKYRPKDFIACYSRFVSSRFPIFFFNRDIPGLDEGIRSILPQEKRRPQILFYIGKSRTDQIPQQIKELAAKHGASVVTVNRAVPAQKHHLWRLLRSSRLLVTTDPVTNLNYEATLFGTPCFVCDNYTKTDYRHYEIPLEGITDDLSSVESMYVEGISPTTHSSIVDSYISSTRDHEKTAFAMLEAINDHLNQITMSTTPNDAEQLATINELRLENDKLKHQLTEVGKTSEPDLGMGFSLNPFVGAGARLKHFLLFCQSVFILLLLRVTTNAQMASECFHKLESHRRRTLERKARAAQLKQARNKVS
jgi:hypothetical protein